ncbi:uncharacterized protein LOC119642007 [Glossina fuscipes]|uniref:Uncharacterized protein LOC119642007 n=1 Tax=Glossina fuscipes TaxID=7396 RepID=A0A9C6DYB9_9MUSC|nr:uncharacterized protein LOC119642007 [Glossina fuscipes]KAI9576960.1 hypothetical protein GQX74_014327 [Glossina fuscipes]
MLQDFQTKQDYARQLRYARSKFRRISSLDLIPEDPSQEESSDEVTSPTISRVNTGINTELLKPSAQPIKKRVGNMVMFWPNLLANIVLLMLRFILYVPLSIAAPSFWLSAILWIFWKLIRIPIGLFKWLLVNETSTNVNGLGTQHNGPKRTVLISCGSTIQTLHLARNFYSAGARVIVFEFDGLFGLARFSTAVDKFYVVPRPAPHNIDNYIAALCHIVRKEKPSVYVPVCATNPAYYDSVAKPHLEVLGCATFMTGVQETLILDDCLQFYQRCASQKINLPPYMSISSLAELWELYEGGFVQQFRNIMVAVGMQGILERFKYILPRQRRDLKFGHEISERQQWLVVRDIPGEHYVTCTTVKNTQVVANVSCRVDHETRNLVPVVANSPTTAADAALIEHWLRVFFAKIRFQRSINCHISFRLVKCQSTGEFLPLGVRLGVSLPYICYNRSHAQTLCRTMKCVPMRSLSLVPPATKTDDSTANTNGSNLAALSWSSLENSSATTALDKREALFAYWDPLPYCAYYHFQLPLESVKTFLQKKRRKATKTLSHRLAIPVH